MILTEFLIKILITEIDFHPENSRNKKDPQIFISGSIVQRY